MSDRVLICDPEFPLARAREILPQAETGRVADAGPGVVAILVSPEAPVGAGDITGAPDLRLIATAERGHGPHRNGRRRGSRASQS